MEGFFQIIFAQIMADYWKSQPRKFCEFCKCWLTDNKPSVDFHEKGKRHQENVKRRINDITRKGHKALEQKKKMDREFQKMEQAALKAYEKDRELDPSLPEAPALPVKTTQELDMGSCSRGKLANAKKGAKPQKDSKSPGDEAAEATAPAPCLVKEWLECLTSGGQTYYWNTATNTSRRDIPPEGYLSINDQRRSILQGPSSSTAEERRDPYGSWTPADETSYRSADLQLPKKVVKVEPIFTVAEQVPEEFKIKEKTVESLQPRGTSNEAPASFKKRKMNWGARKNIRIKTEED